MKKITYLVLLLLLFILNSCQENKKTNGAVSTKSELNEKLSDNDSVLIEIPTTTDFFLSTLEENLSDSVELNKSYRFRFDLNDVIDKNKV